MKRYIEVKKDIIELREMANLVTSQTGITKGIIYISTREGNHGPRVKFFRGKPKNNPSASITIAKNPELVEDSVNITAKEFKEVSKFVSLNYKELLNFWNDGTNWSDPDVTKFKSELKKI